MSLVASVTPEYARDLTDRIKASMAASITLPRPPALVGASPPSCRVYFIQIGNDGPIKIGTTSHAVSSRLKTLQTANPYALRLLGSVSGDREDEVRWHCRFDAVRMSGEWFHPSARLLKAIRHELSL